MRRRLRNLQMELAAGMGMALEIWRKSVHNFSILSSTFLVC